MSTSIHADDAYEDDLRQ